MCAAVKPLNVIEQTFVADFVILQWELSVYRRIKTSLIRSSAYGALEGFLRSELGYDLYREEFEESLAEILQEKLRNRDFAENLAHECALNEPDAVKRVNAVLNL